MKASGSAAWQSVSRVDAAAAGNLQERHKKCLLDMTCQRRSVQLRLIDMSVPHTTAGCQTEQTFPHKHLMDSVQTAQDLWGDWAASHPVVRHLHSIACKSACKGVMTCHYSCSLPLQIILLLCCSLLFAAHLVCCCYATVSVFLTCSFAAFHCARCAKVLYKAVTHSFSVSKYRDDICRALTQHSVLA